jgi:small subunit ribosomal protein S1
MPASVVNTDPYEEMTRIAYGRVLAVSPETGVANIELRSGDATTPAVLATCRLPDDEVLPNPGELVEILLLPGSEIVEKGANVAQRVLLGSLDRAKALVGYRQIYESIGSDREFEATLLRRDGRKGWIVRLEGCEGFAAKDPPLVAKNARAKAGDKCQVQVLDFNRERGNFQLQWSAHLKRRALRMAIDSVTVGDVLPGRVVDVVDYGAFVDVTAPQGTFTALLPNAEVSWKSNTRARDVIQRASSHDFKVIKIVQKEGGEKRVTLSLKATLPSPWDQYEEDLAVGDELMGTVVNVTDYGAFVELLPELDALLHRSNMHPACKAGQVSQLFAVGDRVWCRIVQIDRDAKRIGIAQVVKER